MPSQYKHIFGPVPSRRLGLSLGVDLLGSKICSMDCIYCEVGRTTNLTLERKEYVPSSEVLKELKEYLDKNDNVKPRFITFSGMGEPTLHSKIGYIIDKIHEITDIPVCVLTNSTTIVYDDVYRDLLKADLVIPSMDALSSACVSGLNRPAEGINFDKIVESLARFKNDFKGKLLVEILFVKGYNDNEKELKILSAAVDKIKPDGLQIHTVARPSMAGNAIPVDEDFLEKARGFFNFNSYTIEKFNDINRAEFGDNKDMIKALLKIRSCSFDEICGSTGIGESELRQLLKELDYKGEVIEICFNKKVYYKIFQTNKS